MKIEMNTYTVNTVIFQPKTKQILFSSFCFKHYNPFNFVDGIKQISSTNILAQMKINRLNHWLYLQHGWYSFFKPALYQIDQPVNDSIII